MKKILAIGGGAVALLLGTAGTLYVGVKEDVNMADIYKEMGIDYTDGHTLESYSRMYMKDQLCESTEGTIDYTQEDFILECNLKPEYQALLDNDIEDEIFKVSFTEKFINKMFLTAMMEENSWYVPGENFLNTEGGEQSQGFNFGIKGVWFELEGTTIEAKVAISIDSSNDILDYETVAKVKFDIRSYKDNLTIELDSTHLGFLPVPAKQIIGFLEGAMGDFELKSETFTYNDKELGEQDFGKFDADALKVTFYKDIVRQMMANNVEIPSGIEDVTKIGNRISYTLNEEMLTMMKMYIEEGPNAVRADQVKKNIPELADKEILFDEEDDLYVLNADGTKTYYFIHGKHNLYSTYTVDLEGLKTPEVFYDFDGNEAEDPYLNEDGYHDFTEADYINEIERDLPSIDLTQYAVKQWPNGHGYFLQSIDNTHVLYTSAYDGFYEQVDIDTTNTKDDNTLNFVPTCMIDETGEVTNPMKFFDKDGNQLDYNPYNENHLNWQKETIKYVFNNVVVYDDITYQTNGSGTCSQIELHYVKDGVNNRISVHHDKDIKVLEMTPILADGNIDWENTKYYNELGEEVSNPWENYDWTLNPVMPEDAVHTEPETDVLDTHIPTDAEYIQDGKYELKDTEGNIVMTYEFLDTNNDGIVDILFTTDSSGVTKSLELK